MTSEQTLELWTEVEDADAEELERLTSQLRGQLEELDVEAVEPIPGEPAPDGSKALDWAAIGGLLVQLGPGAITAVVSTIQAWVSRDSKRSVTIKSGHRELVLTAATAEQQERLVEAFLATADD